MNPPIRNLKSLMHPRSVAIVGASDRSYLSKNLWKSLVSSGFEGRIYLVNSNRQEVYGQKCHPSLSALPETVDLALISLPEQSALGALEDSVRAGVPAAALFTLFSSGEPGAGLRADIKSFLAEAPISVCGSGTFGLSNPAGRFSTVMGGKPLLRSGAISLVCQSGGILNSISSRLESLEIGLDGAVATGGEDQLGAAHFLDYLIDQGRSLAIGCVLEQIKDPELFRAACDRAVAKGVAVVVLAVGRSAKGKQATFAHSGSLASDSKVIDGFLDQISAIRVSNLTNMVSVLATFGKLNGQRLADRGAVVTISGGETGLTADLAEKYGISLPELTRSTQLALNEIFETRRLAYGNPVDAASGSLVVLGETDAYARCIDAVEGDPGVDFVLARALDRPGSPERPATPPRGGRKPIFFYSRTAYDEPIASADSTQLVFPDIEEAFLTLARVTQWRRMVERTSSVREGEGPLGAPPVVMPKTDSNILMEHEVFPLLSNVGFMPPPFVVVRKGGTVPATIGAWKGPFVTKIISHTIVHRRSAGGVMLNLADSVEVEKSVSHLFETFGAQIEGVLIEPVLKPDLELILGAKRDRLGLVIMLGFGGTFVEEFEMFSSAISPLGRKEGRLLVEQSKTAAILKRLIGEKSDAAIDKLVSILLSFDALCRGVGSSLEEFDINPLGFYVTDLVFRPLDAKLVLSHPVETTP